VLELGSGIGLLGLTLLKFDNLINSYTFTDSNHLVLKQIERNYSINRELATNSDSKQPTVSIHEFDWTNPNEMRAFDDDINRHLDLILATGLLNTFSF
jgi:16S rRNA G1207 methylase RsmC